MQGSSKVRTFTLMELYDIMTQHQNSTINEKLEFLESTLMSQENYNAEEQKIVKKKILH